MFLKKQQKETGVSDFDPSSESITNTFERGLRSGIAQEKKLAVLEFYKGTVDILRDYEVDLGYGDILNDFISLRDKMLADIDKKLLDKYKDDSKES